MRCLCEFFVFVVVALSIQVAPSTSTEQYSPDLVEPDKGLLFDNFPGHVLQLPNNVNVDQRTQLVASKMDCVSACVGVSWCRSVNFKITPRKNQLHACELLSLDKHTHPNYLKANETFTHLSIKDPCEDNLCLNGGQCIRKKDRQDYRCQCGKGFTGLMCQNDINECSGSPGCHGNARCINLPGSHKCICNDGYTGDGRTCVGITISVSKNCNNAPLYQSTIPHSGEIMSPSYPGTYSHHLNCHWTITSNTKIGLYFKTFATESVLYDPVTIYDGSSSSSTALGKYGGHVKPSNYFTSSSTSLHMTFTTDLSIVNTGFAVKYEALVQGYLRLNGTTSRIGRVEVFYRNQWGTICDHNWDTNDANVVCQQLGFPGAKTVHSSATHGQGSGPIWIDELACTGSESNIQECQSSVWGSHNCNHSEDASVECNKRVRLVNGGAANKGRVEVYHKGQWGTVCDDAWDTKDANVVCRELGYSSASSAPRAARYGQGTGPIWIDETACLGNEDSLLTCGFRGWISGNHGCGHSGDSSAECN